MVPVQNVEWQKVETQNVESQNVESDKRSKMTKGRKWQKLHRKKFTLFEIKDTRYLKKENPWLL